MNVAGFWKRNKEIKVCSGSLAAFRRLLFSPTFVSAARRCVRSAGSCSGELWGHAGGSLVSDGAHSETVSSPENGTYLQRTRLPPPSGLASP